MTIDDLLARKAAKCSILTPPVDVTRYVQVIYVTITAVRPTGDSDEVVAGSSGSPLGR